MNLTTNKSKLKLALLIIALIIAVITVWFTNQIANTIAKEEEQKVKLWAETTKKKANLVKFTQELFTKLSEDEKIKVKMWSDATDLILHTTDDKTTNFLFDIIQNNNNIPVIILKNNNLIKLCRNVDTFIKPNTTIAQKDLLAFSQYPKIAVVYERDTDYIYYKDSKIFADLKYFLYTFTQSFLSEVLTNSSSLPVILVDEKDQIVDYGNIDSNIITDYALRSKMLAKIKKEHMPIEIDLGDGTLKKIYYLNSPVINQLKYYPLILLGIIGAFLFLAYYIFSTTRKAEQNLVWVGMAKETAHQLGTPISSLTAWIEYMKEKDDPTEIDPTTKKVLVEIEKDINRLSLISDRFSKIGSSPKLEEHNVYETLNNSVNYIKSRASKKATITLNVMGGHDQTFFINSSLFDWVIENLLKNALDAIDGIGYIEVTAFQLRDDIIIEIKDSGKGIDPNKLKTIFDPGFTTKKRGWGLGLTLCKRIIENYFKGKIFVKESILNKGTTFRIEIPV